METLQVNGLCKRYEHFALRQVSFSVGEGEIMGFIGRNGAGKTTTLKSLMNMVHPDAGDICFFGLPFREHELEIKGRIGFVSGGFDCYMSKKLGVITDVTRRFYPQWDAPAYERCLRRFALEEEKTPAQLSAGMRVKYALALALSHRAELLILDEPTSGLDPVSREELLEEFLELSSQGVSILFSTHITSDLDQCADRITYIRQGEILASEGRADFLCRYRVAQTQADAFPEEWRGRLLGVCRGKNGCTALLRAAEAGDTPFACRPADLEDVMVHLEKEGEARECPVV